MPPNTLHTDYRIKCPKSVDPALMNPESFKDFIPPNVVINEVRGLTLNQPRRPCRWEVTVTVEGGEAAYYDNAVRYDLRSDLDNYKPRNTNLLKEKKEVCNGVTYWMFEYEVVCKCRLSKVF